MPATTVHPEQRLRTSRAAGVAGVVFAVLFMAVIILFRIVFPALPPAAAVWHAGSSGRAALHWALTLLPFGGIAFLWFMGALRAYVGEAEDKFVATVFLGSGVLFVATLFALATSAGGMLDVTSAHGGESQPQLWEYGHHFTYTLLSSYSMRMAAAFTFTTTKIGHLLGLFPRWLVWSGHLVGIFLLFVVTSVRWSELVFPVWVLMVSCYMLATPRGE